MPFTVSHGAAVLPLRIFCPRYFSFSGLLVGSFSPDLCYFINQLQWSSLAHTWRGTLTLCLPIALMTWFLGYWLREPLVNQLPSPHREYWLNQCQSFRLSLSFLLKLTFSIWLGALTHLVWDGFTHANGIFGRITWVQPLLFQIKSFRFWTYNLLHHFSSLLGLVLLMVVYRHWSIQQGLGPHFFRLFSRKTLGMIVGGVLLSMFFALILCWPILKTSFHFFPFHWVVTSIQIFIIGIVAWACVDFWIFDRQTHSSDS